MTYDYGEGSSFEDGKTYYNSAIEYVGQGRKDDARKNLESAQTIFEMCSQQEPEAARYLKMVEQELQQLG